jgi:hypothetical protein
MSENKKLSVELNQSPKSSFDYEKLEDKGVDFRLFYNSKEDKKRLKNLINRLCQDEETRKDLQKVALFGFKLGLSKSEDAHGSMYYTSKKITLNPRKSDEDLVATIAHESRHVIQCYNKIASFRSLHEPKTEIMVDRATESDAEVFAGLACWRLKENGDKGVWDRFKTSSKTISSSIEKGFEQKKDINEIKTDAFLAQYSGKSMLGYTDDYIKIIQEQQYVGLGYKLKLYRQRSPEEIISKVCKSGDKNYFTKDPNIIAKPKYSGVKEEQKEGLKKILFNKFRDNKQLAQETLDRIEIKPKEDDKKTVMTKIKKEIKASSRN